MASLRWNYPDQVQGSAAFRTTLSAWLSKLPRGDVHYPESVIRTESFTDRTEADFRFGQKQCQGNTALRLTLIQERLFRIAEQHIRH
jgi:hypothetical protein